MKKAFSLIELMVVVVVIGILACVLIPALMRAKSAHTASMSAPANVPSTALTAEQIEQITQIVKHEVSLVKPNVAPQVADDYDVAVENPIDVPKQKRNVLILNNIDGVWYYRSSGDNSLQKMHPSNKLFIFEDGKLIRSQ